jgi:16S rRNA (guanine527-N7)-methyltransferase
VPGVPRESRSPIELDELLGEARLAGFLGPGPLDRQVHHAEGFTLAARRLFPSGPARLVDLGSGGGLPGLVVAVGWPDCTLCLLEANGRRAAFLRRAVERLGLTDRVRVLHERAEVAGRQGGLRASFDAALARSFGRPAVVAECAAPLLEVSGWLIVSEPPRDEADGDGRERWPSLPLRQLGLEPADVIHEDFEYRLLRQVEECPERFPRRNGVPAKKPLF